MTNSPLVEKPVRSLVKALSWRVTGSIDTILLSWLFTGDLTIAAAIGLTEVMTKMVLYYLHERAWNRISLGRITTDDVKICHTTDVPVMQCNQTP
ncbi:MAG: DUF2061 domain-containing protein [Candidatus Thiodiazotropha sp. (ex Troendleina suluensis)]|nr:DUF2061 domain-containing protein [Candidatus Thiodiazotropha sp. (ex Troendleina suluensis)]